MLNGVIFPAYPTNEQIIKISQWFGCARFIWNAKSEENDYLSKYAKKYLPIGTYPPIDQTFSQYKDKYLTPWLFDCPSQILRNSVSNWYYTYRQFIKGFCNKPKRKRKTNYASIHLTKELFKFEKCPDGVVRLFIGTKTNNIGYLNIKKHRKFKEPSSIYLKRKNNRYFISFCYEEKTNIEDALSQKEHLKYFQTLTKEQLEKITIGIDRGVSRPVQAAEEIYDFSKTQKRKKLSKEKYIKRYQKKLSKQKKGSKRRKKTKHKISKSYEKIFNIRNDFCHKTSRSIVDNKNNNIIILEDLATKNMTKKAKPKKSKKTSNYIKNNKKQKSGLNKAILDKSWNKFEVYIKYKAIRANKIWFKIPANYTSQECADCGHIHPDNRKQAIFCCSLCGHTDNADHNAARVIKKRAINLITNSGTELSGQGVLLDIERGAINKSQKAKANCAQSNETLKKKGKAAF